MNTRTLRLWVVIYDKIYMRSVYKIKSPSVPGFKNIDNVNRIAIYYLWMKSCTIVAKNSTFVI